MKRTLLSLVALVFATTVFADNNTGNHHVSFVVSRVIEATADDVWAVVGEDYGGVAKSHPKIVSSHYVNGVQACGEGAERRCVMNEKGTKFVEEKQVNFDPENYTFKSEIYHVNKLPLDPKNNYAIYKVVPLGKKTSKLMITMNLKTDPAFLGGLFKGKFQRTIEDYALAVEHHVLTGEVVNKDNFKEVKKQYRK